MRRLGPFAARTAALLLFGLTTPLGNGARAGTVFTDPYGVGAPDVLGPTADFDIQSLELTLTPTSLAIEVRMNYDGGDTTLAPFSEPGTSFAGVQLNVGDILIHGRSSLWAIPLTPISGGIGGGGLYAVRGPVAVAEPITRGQVLPGSMYQVTGSLTAGQVLGVGPAGDLRADDAVWGEGGNLGIASPDYAGNLPAVTSLGGPEIAIALSIHVDQAFYGDLAHGYSIHFASTTCACDVLDGSVPEPAGLGLLGIAAVALLRAYERLHSAARRIASSSGTWRAPDD